MNIHIGRWLFQVIWWEWRWNIGYWRWPPLETRKRGEAVLPGHWMNFGFHGLYIGPVEFRFHPNHKRT